MFDRSRNRRGLRRMEALPEIIFQSFDVYSDATACDDVMW